MRFLRFGDENRPVVLLIHGFGITWRMWEPVIRALSEEHCVLVAVLDGMDEDRTSEFVSVRKASEEMIREVQERDGGRLFALVGSSLGGTIAMDILAGGGLQIDRVLIDGAPLCAHHPLYVRSAVAFSQWRSRRIVRGNRFILNLIGRAVTPDNHREIVRAAGIMSDRTMDRVMTSAFSYSLPDTVSPGDTRVAYWYGSAEKKMLIRSIEEIRRVLPQVRIREFPGYGHGELCLHHPDVFVRELRCFLKDEPCPPAGAGSQEEERKGTWISGQSPSPQNWNRNGPRILQ